VPLDLRFNSSQTLLDEIHAAKQAFSQREILRGDSWRIELILKKSGCQFSLALAREQPKHIREQMCERTGDDCGRFSRQDLAETSAGFRLQRC